MGILCFCMEGFIQPPNTDMTVITALSITSFGRPPQKDTSSYQQACSTIGHTRDHHFSGARARHFKPLSFIRLPS